LITGISQGGIATTVVEPCPGFDQWHQDGGILPLPLDAVAIAARP